MVEKKCALCGKNSDKIGKGKFVDLYAYLERGMSKKHFLCKECYEARNITNDIGTNGKKREEAIKKLQYHIADKPSIMQDVVNSWINGEEKNYFLGTTDLIYYVQGPEAKLFVFKDHLTILSDFAYEKRVDQNCNMLDYSMFYKCQAHVSENEVAETTNFFFQYRDKYEISDLEKINGDVEVSRVKYGRAFTKLEFNISLGEYGTLSFAKCGYSFKFFYHQNQLMEEIYNFLMKKTSVINEQTVVEEVKAQPQQTTYHSPAFTKSSEAENSFSLADEISKLKGLLDCGILTQEEFDRAKNKLIDRL